jgi:pyruvate formate lyase activating enzyme
MEGKIKLEFYDIIRGTIFNIQKFSLQDGPGIRTTVFLKGCPLRCRWCSNPESQLPYPEIMVHSIRCIGCLSCMETCPNGAILLKEDRVMNIDRNKCDLCYQCTEVCPSGALEMTGRSMMVSEVMEKVMQDRLFYINSGGGVTFSGGEPLAQPEFLLALLKEAKRESLHTVLDTSGYTTWERIEKILNYVDLILYDMKLLDSDLHIQWTGVSNDLILENLKRISGTGKAKIWIRVPIIPSVNNTIEEVERLKTLVKKINPAKVSLLPYHTWGVSKYEKLGLKYDLTAMRPLEEEDLVWIENEIEDCGIDVDTGG